MQINWFVKNAAGEQVFTFNSEGNCLPLESSLVYFHNHVIRNMQDKFEGLKDLKKKYKVESVCQSVIFSDTNFSKLGVSGNSAEERFDNFVAALKDCGKSVCSITHGTCLTSEVQGEVVLIEVAEETGGKFVAVNTYKRVKYEQH